ncbi:alpha/beta hydrolase [[Mycobacterium] wendilense]|uniref:Alpha/beta hydrolase-fold protein n=1 Tax=[Mycobacterium] wendilense TaxID=3064284 RepID=A0ABM9M9X0_9MYCO|nr:alpha/beta hydrolase-fold protein [Mycolicibacterium sp. MU0050]CAJ1580034.1 alpha/beta hydrolase-fold protein [Mycolicibacterium sp. MU0050]
MLSWPLLSGWLPVVLHGAAIAATAVLVWRLWWSGTSQHSRIRVVAGCLAVSATATVVVTYLARNVWLLIPDDSQAAVYVWIGMAMLAISAAIVPVVSDRRLPRTLAGLVAAAVVVAACANQVNAVFGVYPTAADALGTGQFDQVPLPRDDASVRVMADADPVASRWAVPPQLPARGKAASAPIPSPVSGFSARNAEIYLPPAYFADPRPQLPVLVLIAGQPGTPSDWLTAGNLVGTMDSFAAAHAGLAPVVVVPDGTGSEFGDPLCLDSRRGNADSYLSRDVPAWIRTYLTVDTDPHSWAVGGLSYGGTCALQLATNHPDVYPTFLDISGAAEPGLGDRQKTLAETFSGDPAPFIRVNPLDLLRSHRYPGSAGAIVVGAGDSDTVGDSRAVYAATQAAGMNTHYLELPGAHDWRVFSAGLGRELPWLAHQLNLV